MKKRLVSVLLVMALLVPTVTACHDSSKDSQATKDVQATGYDPEEAAKKFDFGELSDEDKNYTIEMGYNNWRPYGRQLSLVKRLVFTKL